VSISFALAFARINGMPFHFFLLNLIQTFLKPRLRIWDKWEDDATLRLFMQTEIPERQTPLIHKQMISTSHLEELALVVNTGGAYQPENIQE